MNKIVLERGDALIVVDMQNDFLPGGQLEVPDGGQIIPTINEYLDLFLKVKLPVFATRDWHPRNHCSFKEYGGIWPVHCVQETNGAAFAKELSFSSSVTIISKADTSDADAYSGFSGTDLHEQLISIGVRRLFIGGLATDYCVLNTVLDASKLGYSVYVLEDAVRAVNVKPDDEVHAIHEMQKAGAHMLRFKQLSRPSHAKV